MPAIMPAMASMLITSALFFAVAATARAASLPADVQGALKTQSEIYIATRRADGARSAAVPVWFWWDADNQILYTSTSPDAHKVKRIRKGSPVFVAVQGKDGPFFEGTAEIVTDPQLVERIGNGYSDKYWVAWLGLFRPRASRVSAGKTVVMKIVLKP
ncbi:MAG: pyridoxamine 5'-phosphate oxidase family protein [Deltaproteobacteria bacterium]|nr:pyridoxamine 5'-phosphate oxidase family protein [Deltaproteobacteria bacterium]MBI3390731.1 pyridoxamine 5'-phosphate oxidase family protein [Deltaproteobacteria bacterium]